MTRPDDLAAHAIAHVLAKAPALCRERNRGSDSWMRRPHQSQGHNIARVAALRSGLPVSTAGVTVNRFCASGLQAIAQAAHMVCAEGADAIIAGGVESISMIQRDGSPNPVVKEQHPGVYMVMGETAEVVAKRYKISREAQDEYSLVSQQRTATAQQDGFFTGELAPMAVTRAVVQDRGESRRGAGHRRARRMQSSRHDDRRARQAVAGLRHTTAGSVTAGNSSQLSDGASATLVMSVDRAKALGLDAAAPASAASRWPAAIPTRWASGRCSRCRSC